LGESERRRLVEFKTQEDVARHIANQDGTCNGVYCRADNEPQKIDCPLCDTISCTSKNIKPRAIEWLKENKPKETEEPEEPKHVYGDSRIKVTEEPKKFGDLGPQEQEVIRKAYSEGRCGYQTLEKTWHPVTVKQGPYDDSTYRISEPQHQSDGESEEDVVNHPQHYTSHPSNVECIQVTRHMGFNLGNVLKYVWRADLKGKAIEDLEKAQFYLADEIQRRKKLNEEK
jgi:hypothetical protein